MMERKGLVGVNSVSAQMASADLYLYNLGIVGEDDTSLMNLVKLHPKENYAYVSARRKRIEELVFCDVYKYTGISVEAMLENPPDIVDDYISVCKERMRRDLANLKEIKDSLP